jgi:hypothetical protein
MKRALIGGTILLLSSVLLAQNATQGDAARSTQLSLDHQAVRSDRTSACPVSLHALQGSESGLVAVRDAKPSPGPSQRIHLILSDTLPDHALSVRVQVRGLSSKSQRMQTVMTSSDRTDLSRVLEVRLVRENENEVAAELLLPGFTSVRSLQLESIAYTDGSRWTLAAGQSCSVVPDPLMLVAGR